MKADRVNGADGCTSSSSNSFSLSADRVSFISFCRYGARVARSARLLKGSGVANVLTFRSVRGVVRPFAMAGSLIVVTRSTRFLEGSVAGMIIAILSVRPFVARAGSLVVVTRLLGWSIVVIVGMFSAAFIVRPFVAMVGCW